MASVTVTRAGNKSVEVTDNGDGTWSFKQPREKVTIRVEFQKIELEPVELPFTDVPADAWYAKLYKGRKQTVKRAADNK